MEKRLIDSFLAFETKYNLFEEELDGVKIWPLIRDKVFFLLEEKLIGYDEKGKKDIDSSFIELFGKLSSIIKNLFNSLLKPIKSAEVLIISHPRRKKINNYYIDVYTDPLLDWLHRPSVVIEPMYQLQHFVPIKNNESTYYLDYIDLWSRGTSLLIRKKLPKRKRSFWKEIDTFFQRQFSVSNINIVDIIEVEFTRFQRAYPLLKRLLKKIKPRIIIEVVGYQRLVKGINIVANELGIPTAELQHGYIGSKHISYNFPLNTKELHSFPDYLFVWGNYWKKNIQLPIDESQILTTGYEYFNRKKQVLNTPKNKINKNLLFISQATIGRELAQKALELSCNPKFKDYKIQFKLHPTEISERFAKYEVLYNSDRINVIDSDYEKDLYSLILESKAVFGVYSTALIEAAGLGKKVYVLNVSGWKAFEDFINEKKLDIEFIDNFTFVDFNKTPKKRESSFLFAPTDYSAINEIIDKQ